MQTRSFRQKIIDAATADGSLDSLYWIVEFAAPARSLPANMRPAAGTMAGPVTFAASSPQQMDTGHPGCARSSNQPALCRNHARIVQGL